MKVETYNVFNPNTVVELDLGESIQQALTLNDRIIGYVGDIKPDISTEYVSALKKRLAQAAQDFDIDAAPFGLDEMSQDLKVLKEHPDLQSLTLRFVGKQLDLPGDFQPGSESIQVTSLNRVRSFERLSYHRVKACADVLGDEQGIRLWKAVIARLLQDNRLEAEKARQERLAQGQEEPAISTIVEHSERAVEYWTEIGLADFAVAVLDEHRALYRFDSCLTPEALKDFEDPDFAYLCSCYIGDAQGFNAARTIHLRRTQTLHHGDFCDELYWDSRVYTEPPEQPSLEFTQNLGRD